MLKCIFSHDFIYIKDGNDEIERLTGTLIPEVIQSKYSYMTVQFTSDHMETRKGFYIQVEFIEPYSCPKEEFLCANKKCVEASNICDGNDDCGDNSDENTICSGDPRSYYYNIH